MMREADFLKMWQRGICTGEPLKLQRAVMQGADNNKR